MPLCYHYLGQGGEHFQHLWSLHPFLSRPLSGPKAAPHLCFISMDSFAKVYRKSFFSGKAGVPVIMTIADHKKCTTNLSSEEIKKGGERHQLSKSHRSRKTKPSFCSQWPPSSERRSDSPSSCYRVTFLPNRAHYKALRASGMGMLCARPERQDGSPSLSLQNFFPTSRAYWGPRRPPLPSQAHPRGWQAILRRLCSWEPVPAAHGDTAGLPALHLPPGDPEWPLLQPCSPIPAPPRLRCVLREGAIDSATFSLVPPKEILKPMCGQT